MVTSSTPPSSTVQAGSRFSPGHWTKRDGRGLGLLDDANKEETTPENALGGSTDIGLVGLSLEAPNHNSHLGYNQTKTQQQEPSTAYNHANLLAWMAHHPANRGQHTLCIRISTDQPWLCLQKEPACAQRARASADQDLRQDAQICDMKPTHIATPTATSSQAPRRPQGRRKAGCTNPGTAGQGTKARVTEHPRHAANHRVRAPTDASLLTDAGLPTRSKPSQPARQAHL